MRIRFDSGSFLNDFRAIIEEAKQNTPSLIVVPTEREVRTFDKVFGDELAGSFVWCCSFSDYFSGVWMKATPRPQHIYIFRADDLFKTFSADAMVEFFTVVSKKKRTQEGGNDNDDIR